MERGYQGVAYLKDHSWLNDYDFLINISQHLSDSEVKLQAKGPLGNKLFEHRKRDL